MCEPCVSKEPPKKLPRKRKSSDSEEDTSKVGNTFWCSRGKYKPMTNAESNCGLDKCEIRENFLKGIPSFVLEIFLSSNLLVRRKLNCAWFLFTLSNFQ